ncbi:type II secretion system F family protein [Solicola sp. PLA-1-18]|uniref:type II secretion system F family protein n=1 Tax=Solicola sp. PLA-1-18 TaxID=3380532 RepID=UPI003B787003
MLAAVLAALAVALVLPPPPVERLRLVLAAPDETGPGPLARLRAGAWWTSPWTIAGLVALVVVWFVPSGPGLVLAALAGLGVRTWVSRLESGAVRRRREQVTRDLPLAVDLVVAALAAGRPPSLALRAAGEAVGGPLADDLARACARIDLGADHLEVWHELGRDPALGPLGRAFARAARTGASVVDVLDHLADDLRRRRRGAAQEVARSVGVRTAAPLGLCFLPAFVLVAIVPAVAAVFSTAVGPALGR